MVRKRSGKRVGNSFLKKRVIPKYLHKGGKGLEKSSSASSSGKNKNGGGGFWGEEEVKNLGLRKKKEPANGGGKGGTGLIKFQS